MCGISIIRRFDSSTVTRESIERMNRALLHRGPDDQGVFIDDKLAMGHTRLSIVDRANGHQPMRSHSERYTICYNGEVYNYQKLTRQLLRLGHIFNTDSDTETILNLHEQYGDRAVEQLDGMFSYILHDKEDDSILLVRDRLGIKPLYYYQDNDLFIAASEIKAIFASGLVEAELDIQSIYDHFYYQFSVPPFTAFKGIKELPPGHTLKIYSDRPAEFTQYWDLQFPQENEAVDDEEEHWVKALEEALERSCQSHLIGEVPIGTYLSGGLDSSATTYFLQKHYQASLDSFSIHFEAPQSDESYAYKPVAKKLGINNTELTITDPAPPDFIQQLEKAIYHLEQPQRLGVDIPHYLLSQLVHQKGFKVVYTGDGADELFGGYDCYRQDAMRVWANEQTDPAERERLYREEYVKEFAKEHIDLLHHLHEPEHQQETCEAYGTYPAWFDFWHILDRQIPQIWNAEREVNTDTRMPAYGETIREKVKGLHPLNQSLYYETKTRLPNWILLKSDRLAMANSVETRVPFLDHHLVELAAMMPTQFKLQGMNEKYLLKKIMQPHLPQIPGEYKKRGFYTPIREWFFSPDRERGNYLSEECIRAAGLFNPTVVTQLISELEQTNEINNIDEYYQSMRIEWLLMLVLSTQILHHQFILKEAPIFHDI